MILYFIMSLCVVHNEQRFDLSLNCKLDGILLQNIFFLIIYIFLHYSISFIKMLSVKYFQLHAIGIQFSKKSNRPKYPDGTGSATLASYFYLLFCCSGDVYVLAVGAGSQPIGQRLGLNLPVYPLKVLFLSRSHFLANIVKRI